MKIFDCFIFNHEIELLEIRLNILNDYVDKFVITEGDVTFRGLPKESYFLKNKERFSQWEDKIILNSITIPECESPWDREIYSRNAMIDLDVFEEDDLILTSDSDEIPNFQEINLENNENKIIIFKQKLFYYKFNLLCSWVDWYGTKGCKKKFLQSFSWLREIKAKKYPIYRLDTFISKNKYMNVKIVDDGGWHFSQLKTPKDIEKKLLNQEHHDEYKLAKKKLPNIADLISRKAIIYDYNAKSTDYKFSKEFKLKSISLDHMPIFLKQNVDKYSEWFDLGK